MTLKNGSFEHPIQGTSGNDTMVGTAADDFFYGAGGHDLLAGGDGNDSLRGGDIWVKDHWQSDPAGDTLMGGNGDDTLEGGAGADYLYGEAGYDHIYGYEGNDILYDEDGAYMDGGAGDDTYFVFDAHTQITHNNQAGDKAIVYADWFKTVAGLNTLYAEGAQQLPYWIDALTFDNVGVLSQATKGNVIKYGFVTTPPANFDDTDKNGFQPFTAAEKAYTRKILDYISSVIDVQFVETSDPSGPYTIALANNTQKNSGGYANEIHAGPSKILVNNDARADDPSLDDGSALNFVLIHEFGHSLGLKHPFAAADAVNNSAYGPYLPAGDDIRSHTVMSYTDDISGHEPMSYSPLDIAALQYIWGVSARAHAGNTTYKLNPYACNMLYDGSGDDTIDGSDLFTKLVLDLRPGYWSYIDHKAGLISADGQITINFGSEIENAIGGAGNDILTGNALDNKLTGGKGNDQLNGGGGIDTAIYSGRHSDYTLRIGSTDSSSTTVTGARNGDGIDTLSGIERLKFADGMVAIDIDSAAGQAYRIYKAAFDRTPDKDGLGYWISQMDHGISLNQVSAFFLKSSEFQTLYGSNLSNADLLDHIYHNVLHRAPDQGGFDYWMKQFDNGITREALLASFSESAENHAALVGVMQSGIEYTPYLG